MDLRDVARSWRLMARNCSSVLDWIWHYTNAIGCTGLMSSITYFLLSAFLTAQESQLITALLFCLRHTLIFSGECWLCFIVWPLKQKKLLFEAVSVILIGSSINPSENTHPEEMIRTGIFTIDAMNLSWRCAWDHSWGNQPWWRHQCLYSQRYQLC